jgi:prepilin-type N-terminal cleavage/methylation domain-containing protein
MNITRKTRNKGFTLVELLVVIAIIASLAAMATPVIMKQQKKAAMTTAISNAKQVHMLMMEFDGDFGAFPNDETAQADQDLNGYSGANSNDYLGQFIAGGYVNSEEIFYAKGGSTTNKKPDNDYSTKSVTLEAGECGFSYVINQSTSDNTGRPILLAPMEGNGETFKIDPYDGKCVALRIDGAAKSLRISKTSKKGNLGGGKTLFDTGQDTVWGTNGFNSADLKHPL